MCVCRQQNGKSERVRGVSWGAVWKERVEGTMWGVDILRSSQLLCEDGDNSPREKVQRWKRNVNLKARNKIKPCFGLSESESLCFLPQLCFLVYWEAMEFCRTIPGRWFPGWLSGKEPAWRCKKCGFDIWVGKSPWVFASMYFLLYFVWANQSLSVLVSSCVIGN